MRREIPTAWVIGAIVAVLAAVAFFYYSRLSGPIVERTPPPVGYFSGSSSPTSPR